MNPDEHYQLLLGKAAQDEFTVDQLIPLENSPDEIIGFHLQQAAEKLLKALLSYKKIEYRRTHNLGELIHLLEKSGESFPPDLEMIRELTPCATEWRYDYLPQEGELEFDRTLFREKLQSLHEWVARRIKNE